MTSGNKIYSNWQLASLVILRVALGWNFFYEGIAKLIDPDWTAMGYLMDSKWIFAGMFHSMATNPSVLSIVDFLNIWGLILIGLGLMLGVLERIAAIAGMLLLGFYYLSHPPLAGLGYLIPSEGNYLIVNKTLIEAFAMWVLYHFPTGKEIGFDRLLFWKKVQK